MKRFAKKAIGKGKPLNNNIKCRGENILTGQLNTEKKMSTQKSFRSDFNLAIEKQKRLTDIYYRQIKREATENLKEANKFITKIRENEMTKNVEWTTKTIVTVAGIGTAIAGNFTFTDLETSSPELSKFIREKTFGYFIDNTSKDIERN